MHTGDVYRLASIADHLKHTHPERNFNCIRLPDPPLTLFNLNQLNDIADGGRTIYLTSNDNIFTRSRWLLGIEDDRGDNRACVVIVVDKGKGVVDVFYFYFFAYNWGERVVRSKLSMLPYLLRCARRMLINELGNRVGDWQALCYSSVDRI
jgi:hypothetical protein